MELMKLKATVLCDNHVFSLNGVIAEHVWTVFLETENGNYLFVPVKEKPLSITPSNLVKILKPYVALYSAITTMIIPADLLQL